MKFLRYLSLLLLLCVSTMAAEAQNVDEFDPDSPGEPTVPVVPPADTTTYYVLSLKATEGGSVKSGSGKYAAGTTIKVEANAAATNYVFTGWSDETGNVVSSALAFSYIMPRKNVTLIANYVFNPSNPSEPTTPSIDDPGPPVETKYKLTLVATEGGSIKSGAGNYDQGSVVTVVANAPAQNFVFRGWSEDGENVLSSSLTYNYQMPDHDVVLTAIYDFVPSSPSEPSVPVLPEKDPEAPTRVLSIVTEEGGVVSVNGNAIGASYVTEVKDGSTVALTVSTSQNFVFSGWYSSNVLFEKSSSLSLQVGEDDISLTAKFDFAPGSPAEPSNPVTNSNEIYLMSMVGLPGDTINYPIYVNNKDTITDLVFNIQFPKKMNVDWSNVGISKDTKGYTFSYKKVSPSSSARSRGVIDNSNGLNETPDEEDYDTYEVTLTGGITPPGNTALLIFPIAIDSDIEKARFRVWVNQVSMTLTDGSDITGIVRNGAINTDYEEPDTYAWFKNLIKVGSSTCTATQPQQSKRRVAFTYDVPINEIAQLLVCAPSFVTFKGKESEYKVTDSYTAENGFWYDNEHLVSEYTADPSKMRLQVQYTPESDKISVMQYPGAYKEGDVDEISVYFTYTYKYYELIVHLDVNGPDPLLSLSQELLNCRDSIAAVRAELTDAYKSASSSHLFAKFAECDSITNLIDYYVKQIDEFTDEMPNAGDVYTSIVTGSESLLEGSEPFIASLRKMMADYQKAYGVLRESLDKFAEEITRIGKLLHPSIYKDAVAYFKDAINILDGGTLTDVMALELADELLVQADRLPSYIQTDIVVAELEDGGELPQHIYDASIVTKLILSGPLNSSDIGYIRTSLPKLHYLDLASARIVAGGESYQHNNTDYQTADNAIGDYMFAGMVKLDTLMLCEKVNAIGRGIIDGSTNILDIIIPKSTQSVASGALSGVNPHIRAEWNTNGARVPENLFGYTGPLLYAIRGTMCELDKDGKPKRLPNIVIDGVADLVVLEGNEECGVYIPESFLAKEVRYTRNFSRENVYHQSSGWETLVLPFDVQTIVSEKVGEIAPFMRDSKYEHQFWLATLTENGFKSQASIKANVPYIISMPNSDMYFEETRINGNITFKAADEAGVEVYQNIELDAAESSIYAFNPVYDREMKAENVYALNEEPFNVTDIVDEEEVIRTMAVGSAFVKNKYDVRPFESYMSALTTAGNSRSYIAIGDNESLTAIDDILEDAATSATRGVEGIFDLRGNRVQQSDMVPGNVYIINGVKIKFE